MHSSDNYRYVTLCAHGNPSSYTQPLIVNHTYHDNVARRIETDIRQRTVEDYAITECGKFLSNDDQRGDAIE